MAVIVFTDPYDHETDVMQIYGNAMLALEDVPNWRDKIMFKDTVDPVALHEMARAGDVVFIDYGGIGGEMGGGSLFDHTERWVKKCIEERESTLFVFVLTMGPEYYSNDLFGLHNVRKIDRAAPPKEWRKFFMEAMI
jgi:hypothetical protein